MDVSLFYFQCLTVTGYPYNFTFDAKGLAGNPFKYPVQGMETFLLVTVYTTYQQHQRPQLFSFNLSDYPVHESFDYLIHSVSWQ